MKELIQIQTELKAPKSHKTKYYNYRSAEDILEAVKPILKAHGCVLTLSDNIVQVGNRIYVQATATLENSSGEVVETTAFAREEESSANMSVAQLTGSSSSYARKYALNGLFCIDETEQDPDTTTARERDEAAAKKTTPAPKVTPAPKATAAPVPQPQAELSLSELLIDFAKCNDRPALVKAWKKYEGTCFEEQAKTELRKRKEELGIEK